MFKIARDIGGHTIDELSEKMSYEELIEWNALYQIESDEMKEAEKKAKRQHKKPRF